MNEQDLGDVFGRILPEQPSTMGWAGAARRRLRRQRSIAGAAAVALAAAVAIPLGIGLGNSSPQVLATPAPNQSGVTSASEQLIPDACGWPAVDATPLTAGELRAAPERVWLCGQDDDVGTARRTVGAPDPLQMGAAEAVAEFEDLPLDRGLADCAPNPLSYLYTLVVEYPDGTHSTVSADHCGFLRDVADSQDYFRGAGEEFVETLHGLWKQEREETGYEFTGVGALCSSLSTSVWRPLDQSALTRAISCGGDTTRPTELPAGLAVDLIASLDATETLRHEEILSDGLPELVFLTPEGDPLSLVRWGDEGRGTGLLAWDDGAENHAWAIPSELQQRIDDFLAEAPDTGETPVSPTLGEEDIGGLTSKVCADIQSGEVSPGSLGRTEGLPTGAEEIWLCGDLKDPFDGLLGPREPLVTDPDRVVEAINALEPAPEGEVMCTEVGGLTFHLAIDYPDGSRRVLAAETSNCEFVGGRVGGRKLLGQIRPMWEAQRAAVGPAVLSDPDLCDTFPTPSHPNRGYTSVLPVESWEAVAGAACGLAEDAVDFDGQVLQRWLPPEVVADITRADDFTVDEWQPSMPSGLPYLVLLNEFGDPLTVDLTADGDIMLPQGTWKPDDQTALLLQDTLTGLRTKPFYEQPKACYDGGPGGTSADLDDVVSGVACLEGFVVPDKGPELAPDFATELGQRFKAESVPMQAGGSSIVVVLQDAAGRHVMLHVDSRHAFDPTQPVGLANEAGDRVWELPEEVRAELELYGFDFAQQ